MSCGEDGCVRAWREVGGGEARVGEVEQGDKRSVKERKRKEKGEGKARFKPY